MLAGILQLFEEITVESVTLQSWSDNNKDFTDYTEMVKLVMGSCSIQEKITLDPLKYEESMADVCFGI